MYSNKKLIILQTTDVRRKLVEHQGPLELSLAQFPSWTETQLEAYGQVWARVWPTDIVMLEE